MFSRILSCAMVVSLLFPAAWAQTTSPETATTAPATQPSVDVATLLKHIPADCTGFVVLRSPRSFADGIKNFYKNLMPPQMAQHMDDMDLLEDFTDDMGEGFDEKGAVAFVLLNVPDRPAGSAPDEEMPDVRFQDVPLVILLPGRDPRKIIPEELREDGKLLVWGNGDNQGYAVDSGKGFIMVSPNRPAIIEMLDVKKSADSVLTDAHKATLTKYDAGAWLDVTKARKAWNSPFTKAAREGIAEEMSWHTGFAVAANAGPAAWVGLTRGMLFVEGATAVAGLTINDKGINFELSEQYAQDSAVGKALAQYKPSTTALTSRLPNLPYIFAYGSDKSFKTPAELKAKQYDWLLGNNHLRGMSNADKALFKKQVLVLQEQVTGVQHYLGPVAAGAQGIGFISVIECKDASAVRKALPELAKAIQGALRGLRGHDGDTEGPGEFTLTYIEALEKSGEVSLDAITVDHPEMANMDAEARQMMRQILGDDKAQLLIAQPDDKTIVITVGGGTEFMKTALAAAGERKDRIASDTLVKASMDQLGVKQPGIVAMVNISNAYNFVGGLMAMMGGTRPLPAAAMPPAAGAVSFDKGGWTFKATVPASAIKECVKAATQSMEGPSGPPDEGF